MVHARTHILGFEKQNFEHLKKCEPFVLLHGQFLNARKTFIKLSEVILDIYVLKFRKYKQNYKRQMN